MKPRLPRLTLITLTLAGCGTASTSNDNWDYVGSVANLRSPPTSMTAERRKEIDDERHGKPGMPSEAIQQKFRNEFEDWKRSVREALNSVRNSCTRETGDTGTRHFFGGYDDAFLACMKARGWIRPLRSNHL
jgi:hypothetical protein